MQASTPQNTAAWWNLKDGEKKILIWVDCDTGHDDAFAILLAAHAPRLDLLGVSTVHGNSSLANTTRNSLSILEAIGRPEINVYPGASKPFCRDAAHAPDIHGDSGLDGTTILPKPTKAAVASSGNSAVEGMYHALSSTAPGTAWLVSTGALTNIGLLFAMYPDLATHIAGLSIMGGAVGRFFSHAQMGKTSRTEDRIALSPDLSRKFPEGLFDNPKPDFKETLRIFKKLGVLRNANSEGGMGLERQLREAYDSFGNTTHYAEFNIYCDPEAAALIFANHALASKTTLIPLDLTHQVIGNAEVLRLLSQDYMGSSERLANSAVRHLFLEIMTFFAETYSRVFGITEGPPMHDPLAVATVFAPDMFEDNDGERFEVSVVKTGDEVPFDHARRSDDIGQCGRTLVKMLPKGSPGVRIPRTVQSVEFWNLINLSLIEADRLSKLVF